MYFITKKSSETGKKFQEVADKSALCDLAIQSFISKLPNVNQYVTCRWSAFGGLEYVIFNNTPNLKVWKKSNEVENGYSPRKTSKEGKELDLLMKQLPKVSYYELNMCIGFDKKMFKCIGFNQNNKDYFCFSINENWGCEIPSDCEEITTSKYKEMFNVSSAS